MTRRGLGSAALQAAGALILAWCLLAFLYVPLGAVLAEVFAGSERSVWGTLRRLAEARNVREAVANTLWMAAATVVTVNLVGLFQVAVLDCLQVRGSGWLRLAYATPLVFASVTAISGYGFVYGPNGAVTHALRAVMPDLAPGWFAGWPAVLFAHSLLMTSYHFLFVRAALRRVDFATVEAARSLGAGPLQALRLVVLPVLAPTVFAASLMVLLTALTSFAAPALLGGRGFRMLNQMILALNAIPRREMAAMLALGLGLVSLAVFLALRSVERRGRYTGGARTPVPIRRIALANPLTRAVVHGLAWTLGLLQAAPVLLTVAFSFAPSASIATDPLPTRFTLANYAAVFGRGEALAPLVNSIGMAGLAIATTLALALYACRLVARSRGVFALAVEFSLFIPWVLPGSLVAMGLILAYDRPNPLVLGQVLLGSYAILPAAYAILIAPMAVRLIAAALAGLDPVLDDAARALGAGPLARLRRVTLPLIAPTLVLVAALSFNDVLNEFTASAFLYNIHNRPLGVAIAALSSNPGPEQVAQQLVYATLAMALSFAVVLLADRLSLHRPPPA